jgi:DsbC/DsbD-like thiol-disulfide interchange protein
MMILGLSKAAILGYRKCMRALAVTFLLVLTAPATAAATAWQELEPGARVRLIASEVLQPDGTTMVGLELDMPQTTKTYWRIPGETGISAEFDFGESTGISGHRVLWPHPQIDTATGYTDFVYFGPTVLPLELAVDHPEPLLEISVTLGVCSDICMPVSANYRLHLDFDTPDRGQELRLAQAAARAPIPWLDDREPVGEVRFDAAEGTLLVPVESPDLDQGSLIADAGPEGPLFGAPQKSPDARLVRLPLLGDEGDDGLVGRTVRLTFTTPMGAFEVSRRVAPSTPAGL